MLFRQLIEIAKETDEISNRFSSVVTIERYSLVLVSAAFLPISSPPLEDNTACRGRGRRLRDTNLYSSVAFWMGRRDRPDSLYFNTSISVSPPPPLSVCILSSLISLDKHCLSVCFILKLPPGFKLDETWQKRGRNRHNHSGAHCIPALIRYSCTRFSLN